MIDSSSFRTIVQANPKANYLSHRAEVDAAIQKVLESGWYILGQEVESFEEEFASYIGVQYGVGVGSGTAALELALEACGIGNRSSVFTVSHTAVATVSAIERLGATPVFVDIDPETFTMDPAALEKVVSEHSVRQPAAIVPVHLYGHPVNIPQILEIAEHYDLFVVEDCAQAHGAKLFNRSVGSWGDIAAFSCYPTKNLGALGDAGIVVTNNQNLADRLKMLRQYGWRKRYISETSGTNSRLDELQAAVLRVKLRYLDEENELRRNIANEYYRLLDGSCVMLPQTRPSVEHVYHQYVIKCKWRDRLQSYLKARGINTLVHYPQPVHLQEFYKTGYDDIPKLPNTERVSSEILSLPIYPELPIEDVLIVANSIQHWSST